ncbi:MAG: DUF4038 domain-containing protein [Spirochaetota bacterium]
MNSRIGIHADGRTFVRDGERWFYLADTAWSGVTNPTDDEWERYLDLRAEQGFTAVQINLLPQWDRSPSPLPVHPFAQAADGSYDFARPADDYFEATSRRLAAIAERGMVPAVVLLWCNYVPDTWASARRPQDIIPERALERYLRLAIETARPHGPVYLVSGDTDFQTERATAYYAAGLRLAKQLDPQGLTTLHVKGSFHGGAPDLLAMRELDFSTFQSGHGESTWHRAHELARVFRAKMPPRPIVNAEPCYEGHGHGGGEGRYDARDVRQAAWQGLLAGANAGVTYGAHGVWGWHRPGLAFGSIGFSGMPYAWDEAIGFPGAEDYAYIRHLFERYGLAGLEPVETPALPDGVVAAVGPGTAGDGATPAAAVYLPYPMDIALEDLPVDDAAALRWQRVDLARRAIESVRTVEIDGTEHLWKGRGTADALLIGS